MRRVGPNAADLGQPFVLNRTVSKLLKSVKTISLERERERKKKKRNEKGNHPRRGVCIALHAHVHVHVHVYGVMDLLKSIYP